MLIAGTILGASLGLGLDYSVNLGVELVKRDEFLKDVSEVLRATQRDYHNILEQELHRASRSDHLFFKLMDK